MEDIEEMTLQRLEILETGETISGELSLSVSGLTVTFMNIANRYSSGLMKME